MSLTLKLARFCLFLIALASLSVSLFNPISLAQAQPLQTHNQDSFSLSINFLPSSVRRLCVGDSAVFRFAASIQDLGPLAPLVPTQISVTTTQGSAKPVVFQMYGTYGVFQFQYTAENAGDETITVQAVDHSGSASKSFKVLEGCDYEVTFFAKDQQDVETGGFAVEFWGAGDLGLARRDDPNLALKGNGKDAASLQMYAAVPQAFSCGLAPYSGNSTFSMDGNLLPEQDVLHFDLNFDPITFPSHMMFSCTAAGLGDVNFDIPIPKSSGDANSLNMKGIEVDTAGGTYQFAFGKSTGVMTVRKVQQ